MFTTKVLGECHLAADESSVPITDVISGGVVERSRVEGRNVSELDAGMVHVEAADQVRLVTEGAASVAKKK